MMDDNGKRERDKMKKNLFVGVDFIGDEELRVNSNDKRKSRCDTFLSTLSDFFDRITPLRNEVNHIEARYDRSISNFFVFFRFLVKFNILTCMGFLYLVIYHIVEDYEGLTYICNS